MTHKDKADQGPVFPLRVLFADGGIVVVRDEDAIRCDLEWLDTDDTREPVKVYDWHGRRVRLKVEALEIEVLELA